jgi:hypothetical protein
MIPLTNLQQAKRLIDTGQRPRQVNCKICPWTEEEDRMLIEQVKMNSAQNWIKIAHNLEG